MHRYDFAVKYNEAVICDLCKINIATIPYDAPKKWNHLVCGHCMINVIVPDLLIRVDVYKNEKLSVIDDWKKRIFNRDKEQIRKHFFFSKKLFQK